MLKNIKARYIWITIGVVFLITIGLILGITFADSTWKMPLIIALTICFLFLTFAVQIASSKTFQYKRKIKYPKKLYTSKVSSFEEKLESLKYEKRITNYGLSYLKIQNENAYKVVELSEIIDNINLSGIKEENIYLLESLFDEEESEPIKQYQNENVLSDVLYESDINEVICDESYRIYRINK